LIRISFAGDSGRRVLSVWKTRADTLEPRLAATMNMAMLRLQQVIQRDKLSGQVLNARSGKLRASINVPPVEVSGSTITGTVEGAGGPAWYGQVHEAGGRGPYQILPVNKKALAWLPQGATAMTPSGRLAGVQEIMRRTRAGSGSALFAAAGGVVVKGVIHPPLPARPFMAPALKEQTPEIVAALQKTLTD
jgi:hypothetical protein